MKTPQRVVSAVRSWPRPRRAFAAAVALAGAALVILLAEALVVSRLDPGRTGSRVTRVYARPPVLVHGMRASRAVVEDHLERVGYDRASGGRVAVGEYYLGSRAWIIGRRGARHLGPVAPGGFAILRLDGSGRILLMEDEEGRRLSRVTLEPEWIGTIGRGFGKDVIQVNLPEVPEHLIAAILRVEDQRFFHHGGLDCRRIVAAALANLRAGRVVQGGSTLTQQLAKNLFLSPRRTLVRKLREAVMAVVLESRYDKNEILEAYLNEIYLGQDGALAIHGVGGAAEHYFGKRVGDLDLSEAALLAALIRAPSLYSPHRNPSLARKRRDLVLRAMLEGGDVSEEDFERAVGRPIALQRRPPPPPSARYFVDFVRDRLEGAGEVLRDTGLDGVTEGESRGVVWREGWGGSLVTTLDARLQRTAEEAVGEGLANLERAYPWLRREAGRQGLLQAALVAIDPATGEILAMVGGRDYATSQFNRATQARRQPGSAFKPVVAVAALSRDPARQQPDLTLASIVLDEPLVIETPSGPWQPANYNRQYAGPVTVREALERSLNVPFARIGALVGPDRIVAAARDLGIESPLDPYASLALGTSEVSPLELTRAFGVLAADGYRANPVMMLAIVDSWGTPRVEAQRGGRQAYHPAEVYLVTSALRGAVDSGTGRALRDLGFLGDVAAKSGTTDDFRDGWFVGYTPTLVVGVWVGFDRGGGLRLPGARVALPIFARFLTDAVGSYGNEGAYGSDGFRPPAGLELVEVNPETGLRAGWGCPGELELFLEGTAPVESCSRLRWDGRAVRRLVERGGDEVPRLLLQLLGRLGLDGPRELELRNRD